MADAIVFRNVSKSFGARQAVVDLGLVVPEGSLFGFLGPNGSGKTTSLRLLMGMIAPDRGGIDLFGRPASGTRRPGVGYLPEERGLYRRARVCDMLRFVGRLRGMRGAHLERDVDQWLERLDLGRYRDNEIEALSKGAAQRAQLAAAALGAPRLAVLDEPFTALDPVHAEAVKHAIFEIRARGATVLLSTHDMQGAEAMCDRIAMMRNGRKVLDGTLDEVLGAPHASEVRVLVGEADRAALASMRQVVSIEAEAGGYRVRLDGDPQQFLRELSARATIKRFELVRSTLHEIFVRLATVEEDEPAKPAQAEPPG